MVKNDPDRDEADIPDDKKDCAEELLNDLWEYHVLANYWTPLKPSYNSRKDKESVFLPPTRYGHAGTFVFMDD